MGKKTYTQLYGLSSRIVYNLWGLTGAFLTLAFECKLVNRKLKLFLKTIGSVNRSVLVSWSGLLLPTENIPLRQPFDPKSAEHVQQLRPMVHAVRNDVGDAAPICLLGRRVV
jgi:hypothetical protein